MSVRPTMADLIARVRAACSDAAGASQVFTDAEIQDVLDRHRIDLAYEELAYRETRAPSATTYLDYYSAVGDFETDAKLYDGSYNLLTPSTSDLLTGHWTFAASQSPPVYLVAKTYDVHASAAEVLEAWAAKVKLDFTAMVSGDQFSRSQKHQMLMEQARTERSRSRVLVHTAERTDMEVR